MPDRSHDAIDDDRRGAISTPSCAAATGVALGAVLLSAAPTAVAQAIPDGSTPNTRVVASGGTVTVDGGTIAGANQFHSFSRFNVGRGGVVDFVQSGPEAIDNVISRVTGGVPSFIEGALRVSIPDANLFLINPSGVVVAGDAVIDVPGAFHLSTADRLDFHGGESLPTGTTAGAFSAAAPSAFGFLPANRSEVVFTQTTTSVANEGAPVTLTAPTIVIDGATLTLDSRPLSVQAVGADGAVLTLETIGAEGAVGGRLDVANGSTIETGEGAVRLRGGSITVADSAIETTGADLQLAAATSIVVAGSDAAPARLASGLGAAGETNASLTLDASASGGSVTLRDAQTTNANRGALSLDAATVTLVDVAANRLSFDATTFFQDGRLDFIDGRAPRDFTLSGRADDITMNGEVDIASERCLGVCFDERPEIALKGGDISIGASFFIDAGDARSDAARAAIDIDGDDIAFTTLSLFVIDGVDGIDIDATGDFSARASSTLFRLEDAESDAFGFQLSARRIAFDSGSSIGFESGGDFDACLADPSTCLVDAPAVDGGGVVFDAIGDATLADAFFVFRTISDFGNGAFEISSAEGDVRIDNVDIVRGSFVDADGALGDFQISAPAGDVSLVGVNYLSLGEAPTPEDPTTFGVGDFAIGARSIAIEQSVISIGSASEEQLAALAGVAPIDSETPTPGSVAASIQPGAPAGSITLVADDAVTLQGSTLSTAGVPADVAATDTLGDVTLQAARVDIRGSEVSTAIIGGPASGVVDAGDVSIRAETALSLDGSVVTTTTSNDAAAAGAVLLEARTLRLVETDVLAEAASAGDVGDVTARAGGSFAAVDSTIATNATTGAAGAISILTGSTAPVFLIGSDIETSSDADTGGDVRIEGFVDGVESVGVFLAGTVIDAVGEIDASSLTVDVPLLLDGASLINVDGFISAQQIEAPNVEADIVEVGVEDAARALADQCASERFGDASILAFQTELGPFTGPAMEAPSGFQPEFYFVDQAAAPTKAGEEVAGCAGVKRLDARVFAR